MRGALDLRPMRITQPIHKLRTELHDIPRKVPIQIHILKLIINPLYFNHELVELFMQGINFINFSFDGKVDFAKIHCQTLHKVNYPLMLLHIVPSQSVQLMYKAQTTFKQIQISVCLINSIILISFHPLIPLPLPIKSLLQKTPIFLHKHLLQKPLCLAPPLTFHLAQDVHHPFIQPHTIIYGIMNKHQHFQGTKHIHFLLVLRIETFHFML